MNNKIIIVMILGFLLLGCTGQDDTPASDQNKTEEQIVEEQEDREPSEEVTEPEENVAGEEKETSGEEPSEKPGKTKVIMLGRSVAHGWMDYMGLEWTCDDEECLTGGPIGEYNDYYMTYYHLDYPPEIANSAAEGVDMRGADAEIVFFKFCFADFASDQTMANAENNIELTKDVYEKIVEERGKKLIVGTALPKVSARTQPALVGNHERYNEWLEDYASTHDDIWVFDLNGMLSARDGSLKDEYQSSPEDSHLNKDAYSHITPDFFELLNEVG